MSIEDRVDKTLKHALRSRTDRTWRKCQTCNGQRLVLQLSPEMHDAWVAELRIRTGRAVAVITHYLCVPILQLPHLPQGTVQAAECWDCCEIPPIPDDPDALARFLQ